MVVLDLPDAIFLDIVVSISGLNNISGCSHSEFIDSRVGGELSVLTDLDVAIEDLALRFLQKERVEVVLHRVEVCRRRAKRAHRVSAMPSKKKAISHLPVRGVSLTVARRTGLVVYRLATIRESPVARASFHNSKRARTSPSDTVSSAFAGALNFLAFNVFIPNKLSSELVTWRASLDRVNRCETLADGAKASADATRERAMATAENFIFEGKVMRWKVRL